MSLNNENVFPKHKNNWTSVVNNLIISNFFPHLSRYYQESSNNFILQKLGFLRKNIRRKHNVSNF